MSTAVLMKQPIAGVFPPQLSEATIMRPVGCDKCRFLGYKGRMGIFEICVLDDEGPLAALVRNQAVGTNYEAVRGRGATRGNGCCTRG